MNILKIQARYENGIDIDNSLRASEIVNIYEMAQDRKSSEETNVKKE